MSRNIEYDRAWRAKNKEKIKQYRKKYTSKPEVKKKYRELHQKYRQNNPEKHKWYKNKWRYGITKDQYDKMFQTQKGLCKICEHEPRTGRTLVIDHSHKNGKVRGLLCHDCNLTLGKYEGNPEWLVKMISYIVENGWPTIMSEDIKNRLVV